MGLPNSLYVKKLKLHVPMLSSQHQNCFIPSKKKGTCKQVKSHTLLQIFSTFLFSTSAIQPCSTFKNCTQGFAHSLLIKALYGFLIRAKFDLRKEKSTK